jgi:hypothetical protein
MGLQMVILLDPKQVVSSSKNSSCPRWSTRKPSPGCFCREWITIKEFAGERRFELKSLEMGKIKCI